MPNTLLEMSAARLDLGCLDVEYRTMDGAHDGSELRRLQREVLLELGRNSLLFQQIELQMKFLLTRSDFKGTLNELRALRENRASAVDKRTLGQLARAWQDSHLGQSVQNDIDPPVSEDGGYAFRVSFPMKEPERERFLLRMQELVEIRNRMAHHFLERFQFMSSEDCRRALAELKQEAKSIDAFRKDLAVLVGALRDSAKELLSELAAELKRSVQTEPGDPG